MSPKNEANVSFFLEEDFPRSWSARAFLCSSDDARTELRASLKSIPTQSSPSCHTCHSEPPPLKLRSYPHYTCYTYYSEPLPLKLCPPIPPTNFTLTYNE